MVIRKEHWGFTTYHTEARYVVKDLWVKNRLVG